MMNTPELERLAELVQRANISELTLRQGDARVTLRKAARPTVETTGSELVPYEEAAVSWDEAATPPAPAEAVTVSAPLVGVFHHVKPVVGLAAKVEAGQVLGVIEAMRLVNEVTAPADGVISDVMIEDGAAVEYGQPLFALDPE